MRVGLLGFGVVGKGVYDIVAKLPQIQVAKVLCLEDITLPDAEVVSSFQSIVEDDTIDTVIEAMGGLHPAYEFVRAAMEAGKNIVTSNKALVATFYDDLIPFAEEKGLKFRCTAAVGGGIGWLSELERANRAQTIIQVGGIMNGTCNYILDSMTQWELGYEEALSHAQMLGYAEADPSTDVEGTDTWHKLIVSSNIAFGVSLDISAIPAAGIQNITKADVDAFRAHGLVCKLVSTGKKRKSGYSAYVQPTLFFQGEPEAAVPVNYNHITLIGDISGRQSFFGQGAGRYPTAYNVVQDCMDFLRGNGFYCAYGKKVKVVNDEKYSYYVRGGKDFWLEEMTAETWDEAVITKPVSVETMHKWLQAHPGAFIAAMPKKTPKAKFEV